MAPDGLEWRCEHWQRDLGDWGAWVMVGSAESLRSIRGMHRQLMRGHFAEVFRIRRARRVEPSAVFESEATAAEVAGGFFGLAAASAVDVAERTEAADARLDLTRAALGLDRDAPMPTPAECGVRWRR